MRIAYVGNYGPEWSTENDVRLAFEALGHEVDPLQENKLTPERLRDAALGADLVLWTGTWGDAIDLGDALDVFHACARAGIPTATYHLDTFWSTGRDGRKWWREPMFHTAHVFTADGDHEAEWARLGVRHHWLAPGVRHTAAVVGEHRERYACDVAFVGSNGVGYHEDVWPYRRQLVDELRAMCARNGWTFRNPGGDEPKIDRGNMADFYASARVTVGDSLCPLREHARYWSDRVPEATGRGGLLVMPRIDALAHEWRSTLPRYRWGEFDHLEEQVARYLDDAEANEATRAACREVTLDRHLYTHRAQTILETVGLA